MELLRDKDQGGGEFSNSWRILLPSLCFRSTQVEMPSADPLKKIDLRNFGFTSIVGLSLDKILSGLATFFSKKKNTF